MIFRSVSIFALACAFVAPASAAETADATGEDQTQWITVTGQREEYGVKSTRTGTRTDTEIKGGSFLQPELDRRSTRGG